MDTAPHAPSYGKSLPFHIQLGRSAQAVTALWLTASTVWNAGMALVGALGPRGEHSTAQAAGVIGIVVGGRFGGPIIDIILVCTVTGFITYMVLKYICEQKWVTEQKEIKECWEEFTWYNPWSWVKSVVCSITWVTVSILKWICGWKEILVTVAVLTCIIAGIIVLV